MLTHSVESSSLERDLRRSKVTHLEAWGLGWYSQSPYPPWLSTTKSTKSATLGSSVEAPTLQQRSRIWATSKRA